MCPDSLLRLETYNGVMLVANNKALRDGVNLMIKKVVLTVAFFLLMPAASFAAIDLLGDEDCFGTNDVCLEDGSTWLPGGWAAVTSTVDDPPFTDTQISDGAIVSFTHTLSPGSYSNTSFEMRTLGIADIAGPYDVLIDGVVVGQMPLDGFGHILVETFVFPFDPALLSDGSVTVSFDPEPGDSWAIDYSKITYGDGEATPVPTLSQWALIVLTMLMAAFGYLRLGRRHY